MSRLQLALRVADLEASVAFYSKLFGAGPAKRRPGYANFAIAEPPLKLVLLEGTPGDPTRMDHLGVEVETTGQVTGATARLAAEGLPRAPPGRAAGGPPPAREKAPPGCSPAQDRVGAPPPGGEPWEVYVVKS